MQIYEGMTSIRDAQFSICGPELSVLIGRRFDEISGYPEFNAPSFLRVIVLEASDVLVEINSALGFDLLERNCDAIEGHREWFELTLVLSDDGAGVIVYIHKSPRIDPLLLRYCHEQMELLSS